MRCSFQQRTRFAFGCCPVVIGNDHGRIPFAGISCDSEFALCPPAAREPKHVVWIAAVAETLLQGLIKAFATIKTERRQGRQSDPEDLLRATHKLVKALLNRPLFAEYPQHSEAP